MSQILKCPKNENIQMLVFCSVLSGIKKSKIKNPQRLIRQTYSRVMIESNLSSDRKAFRKASKNTMAPPPKGGGAQFLVNIKDG